MKSHSAAKSQQHGGARAARIGGYLAVPRQAKLLFPFSKKAGGAGLTSSTCHMHSCTKTHTEQRCHPYFYIVKRRDGFVLMYSNRLGRFIFQIHPSS